MVAILDNVVAAGSAARLPVADRGGILAEATCSDGFAAADAATVANGGALAMAGDGE